MLAVLLLAFVVAAVRINNSVVLDPPEDRAS